MQFWPGIIVDVTRGWKGWRMRRTLFTNINSLFTRRYYSTIIWNRNETLMDDSAFAISFQKFAIFQQTLRRHKISTTNIQKKNSVHYASHQEPISLIWTNILFNLTPFERTFQNQFIISNSKTIPKPRSSLYFPGRSFIRTLEL